MISPKVKGWADVFTEYMRLETPQPTPPTTKLAYFTTFHPFHPNIVSHPACSGPLPAMGAGWFSLVTSFNLCWKTTSDGRSRMTPALMPGRCANTPCWSHVHLKLLGVRDKTLWDHSYATVHICSSSFSTWFQLLWIRGIPIPALGHFRGLYPNIWDPTSRWWSDGPPACCQARSAQLPSKKNEPGKAPLQDGSKVGYRWDVIQSFYADKYIYMYLSLYL